MSVEMDEQLYERYLRGEEDALRVLIDRYRESLVLFLFGYVHNMEDAEELMLDAFAVAASGTSRFSGKSSFKTWLYSIGRNLARKHLRRQRLKLVAFDQFVDTQDQKILPEELLLTKERNRVLHAALRELPSDYRQALYLLEIEGMSVEEAARVMGKNKKQLYNLAFRGRQAVREILKKKGIKDPRD